MFLAILFFISLIGITVMVGRKLFLLKEGQNQHGEEFSFDVLEFIDIKYALLRNIKRYGYKALVVIIRLSIKSSKILKQAGHQIKNQTDKILMRFVKREEKEKKVSNFLKMVSEYKHKIKRIKHQIKEEEGL